MFGTHQHLSPTTLEEFLMPNSDQKLALIEEYLHNALAGFQMDPADSHFQSGYENALKDVQQYVASL